jgi:lipid-binding SYLF domain-containing protein
MIMSTLWTKVTQDATHSVQDVYSHWVLGDDTGKSAVFSWLCDAEMADDLGLRFIEIHGRAYVKSVASGSPADAAGIQPQDAVQLAVEVTGHHAVKYALDLEARGNRITYDQLCRLLQFSPHLFLSPPIDMDYSAQIQRWNGPPIPSTICAPILVPADGSSSSDASDTAGDRPLRHRSTAAAISSHHHQQPLLFVFRRTVQRSHAVVLSFRLDDECDLACSLVRRLAPTADYANDPMVLLNDSDNLLLESNFTKRNGGAGSTVSISNLDDGVDVFERHRMEKMGQLRAKMTAQAMEVGRNDDVEAATIRGMIQKAVGLAFVRSSKVVMGVSVHIGSGIVIARLPDGTWSAPSAVGTWGLGLGLQFGLEVAEYIFILQTQEALQHFRKGDSYTVGGNLGMAIGAMGRAAYGAASLEGTCGTDTSGAVQLDDEYNDEERPSQGKLAIAPIVAYAKSQGLYIGVSLGKPQMMSCSRERRFHSEICHCQRGHGSSPDRM